MAKAVAEPVAPSELARLLFEPTPGRTEFALRLAFICAAATVMGEIYRKPPELALSVYLAFFVNKPDRVTSVLLGLAATVLISVCVLIVLGGEIFLIDHPPWRVPFIAAVSLMFVFVGSASAISALGGIIALTIGYGLDVMTQLPVNELASRGIVYGWLLIMLPATVSIVVNLVIAPSPRSLVQRDLAAGLRVAAKLLVSPDRATRSAARETVRNDYEEALGRLKLAKLEHVTPARDIEALGQAALSTTTLLTLANLVDRDPSARPSPSACASLAKTLDEMAGVLADGAYPVEIEAPPPEVTRLSPRAAAVVAEMHAQIEGFAAPPHAPGAEADKPAKQKKSFFKPDALTNPAYARHALKTTTAAMTCYVLYTTLEWSSIHTCFLTCYIVSLTTVADSVQKLALRISGCLVGAAVGIGAIVYVIPHLTSITELCAVVFLGSYVSAWVAGGSPRIAYAGFQMAFAFFLCVLQKYKPGTEMYVARDRVFGILIGNAVSYLVLTRVWPVSVGPRIAGAVVAALRHLRDVAAATSRHEGSTAAARAQAAVGGIENDLHLARLEPTALRPAPEWIEDRERAVEEISELAEILVVGAGTETREEDAVKRRLDELADALSGDAAGHVVGEPEIVESPPSPGWEPFRETVEGALRRLEDELEVEVEGRPTPDGLLTHG
jgi:multidrug resistance protein MdtO